jgi:hypothetical protein
MVLAKHAMQVANSVQPPAHVTGVHLHKSELHHHTPTLAFTLVKPLAKIRKTVALSAPATVATHVLPV